MAVFKPTVITVQRGKAAEKRVWTIISLNLCDQQHSPEANVLRLARLIKTRALLC